jgi:hypothetical protein
MLTSADTGGKASSEFECECEGLECEVVAAEMLRMSCPSWQSFEAALRGVSGVRFRFLIGLNHDKWLCVEPFPAGGRSRGMLLTDIEGVSEDSYHWALSTLTTTEIL